MPRIFSNVTSLNAQRHLEINTQRLSVSVERIASGLRINRGSDDATGLAISQSIASDTRALSQAIRNANDGISMINTADGALNEQAAILIRLRELASRAATGTVGSTDRQTINLEFSSLRNEIDRIAATTAFNGQLLIDGSLASTITSTSQILIQIGLDGTSNSRINLNTTVALQAITSTGLGINTLSVTAAANALTTLTSINSALNVVNQARGRVGSVQNRLAHSVASMSTIVENLTAAQSSMRDADIAAEVADLTRNQILVQSATAMVGQANLLPRSVLTLLA